MELTSLKISFENISATEPNELKGTFLRINKWWACKTIKIIPKQK